MSNEYPPPGPGQDPAGQGQPGQNPPNDPQGGTPPPPPPSYGDVSQGYGQPGQPGAPGQGQPPYGQPPAYPPPGPGAPGGYGPAKKSPLAITSLVTGIIGILPCCWSLPIFAIAAVVTGFLARKQIDQSQGQIPGRGMATAGLVLGIVAIVIAVVYWILYAAGVFDNMIQYNFETNS